MKRGGATAAKCALAWGLSLLIKTGGFFDAPHLAMVCFCLESHDQQAGKQMNTLTKLEGKIN